MKDLWGTLWVLSLIIYFTFPGKFAVFLFLLSLAGMAYDWHVANPKKRSYPRKE